MRFIGIGGQHSYGKDVIADHLIYLSNKKNSVSWVKRGMATPVKETFCKMFGVDIDFVEKWKRNPEPPPGFKKNVRQSLQFIGDGAREIDPYVWIKQMVKFSDENLDKNLIIPDCRYFNEVELIKKKDGFTILVYRDGFLNDDANDSESQIRKVLDWIIKNQFPEGFVAQNILNYKEYPKEILLYDYFILNDGTLEKFHGKIENNIFPLISGG